MILYSLACRKRKLRSKYFLYHQIYFYKLTKHIHRWSHFVHRTVHRLRIKDEDEESREKEMTDTSSKEDEFEDDVSSDEDSDGEDTTDKLESIPLTGEIIWFRTQTNV